MSAYTYGNCVYFNNLTDTPNKHNNNIILNKITYFYIKSLLKLMNDIFESLPKLFVGIMQKENGQIPVSKLWLSYQNSMY